MAGTAPAAIPPVPAEPCTGIFTLAGGCTPLPTPTQAPSGGPSPDGPLAPLAPAVAPAPIVVGVRPASITPGFVCAPGADDCCPGGECVSGGHACVSNTGLPTAQITKAKWQGGCPAAVAPAAAPAAAGGAPTAPTPPAPTIATNYGTVPALVSDSHSPKLAAGGSPSCPKCPLSAGAADPVAPPSPPPAPSLGESGISGVNPHIALVRTPERLAFWAKQRAESLANSIAIIARCGAYCNDKGENYCHAYYNLQSGVRLQGWDSAALGGNPLVAVDTTSPLTLCSAIEISPEEKAVKEYADAEVAAKFQQCGERFPWGNKTAAFIARRQFCAVQAEARETGAGATPPILAPYLDLAYDKDNTAVLHEEKVRCGWLFCFLSTSYRLSFPPLLLRTRARSLRYRFEGASRSR